jgi:hypothetical protein
MPKRQWELIEACKPKRQGHVWVVEDRSGERGLFKFATEQQWYFSGPLVANEVVASSLSQRLGLPVAELEHASVQGLDGVWREGIVALASTAPETIPWSEAHDRIHDRAEEHVNQIDLLSQLVVFDAWIANIDRASGQNLVLYRQHPDERYDWYLAGHGHSLYGSPRKWARGAWHMPIWEQLWRFYNVPKGLLRLQSSMEALEPMILKIEGLKESEIEGVLRQVPRGALRPRERQFIKRLLLRRQKRLRKIIESWLAYGGPKEHPFRSKA